MWMHPKMEARLFSQHEKSEIHRNQCFKSGQTKLTALSFRDTFGDELDNIGS